MVSIVEVLRTFQVNTQNIQTKILKRSKDQYIFVLLLLLFATTNNYPKILFCIFPKIVFFLTLVDNICS